MREDDNGLYLFHGLVAGPPPHARGRRDDVLQLRLRAGITPGVRGDDISGAFSNVLGIGPPAYAGTTRRWCAA
jgi:hypothetical protein